MPKLLYMLIKTIISVHLMITFSLIDFFNKKGVVQNLSFYESNWTSFVDREID